MNSQPELPFATIRTTGDAEMATRYEYAKDMHRLQAERSLAREGIRFSVAQADLGGGLERTARNAELSDRFGAFIENFEPWKQDIAIGFEAFDLPELSAAEVRKMTEEDQRTLALHFDEYVSRIEGRGRLLATPGSADDPKFASYDFADEAQAINYGRELQQFAATIKETDVYSILHFLAERIEQSVSKRHHRTLKNRHQHGLAIVIRDTKSGKLRIRREADEYSNRAS